MGAIPNSFLSRIESLGDNCELGFVLRNLEYEKGGLFRWTITPVDKLVSFLENLDQDLFQYKNLSPFSPGMVIDNNTGFSFHTKMRSEKDESGELNYVHSEAEMQDIYTKEKSKLDYLLSGFVERLNAPCGSIFLVKANKGIASSAVCRLAVLINGYSDKHVLVEVRSSESYDKQQPLVRTHTHYVAELPKFAPYTQANDICFEDWNALLEKIMIHEEINNQIGSLPIAV